MVSLASCRLIITTDDGGYISSASGANNCHQAECIIEVEDKFEETFTAIAADGYRFIAWAGICEHKSITQTCQLKLSKLTGELAIHDDDVELSAVFESTATPRVWFRDADADGFGAANLSQLSTGQPSGFVINNSDCNDSNNTVYPGATELHDSLDNNCNGTIDEGFTPTRYYLDQDGDGGLLRHFASCQFECPSRNLPFDCYLHL